MNSSPINTGTSNLEEAKKILACRITTHYSAAEIENLISAANLACDKKKSGTLLRAMIQRRPKVSRESHARHLRVV